MNDLTEIYTTGLKKLESARLNTISTGRSGSSPATTWSCLLQKNTSKWRNYWEGYWFNLFWKPTFTNYPERLNTKS